MTPVTHAPPSIQAAVRFFGAENYAFGDQLLLGVAELRILLVAVQSHERVRELVHARRGARVVAAQPGADADRAALVVVEGVKAVGQRDRLDAHLELAGERVEGVQRPAEIVPGQRDDRALERRGMIGLSSGAGSAGGGRGSTCAWEKTASSL